jgi:hypothetical protein
MLKTPFVALILILVLFIGTSFNQEVPEYQKISGPFTHKNLSIFLIHGADEYSITNLITLQEAIEKKKIIIHETENVSELNVENISNSFVFIQSGDIVKGGKQDRVIQFDMVVKPKSGKIPITSFCVEQQRWSKRGQESLEQFNSASNRISSKRLKLAAKQNESQSAVWNEVAVVQEKLGKNVGKPVNSEVSASSLQLTLENEEISKLTTQYIDNLSSIINDKSDAIGYVFTINGEINSADIYANSKLFKKMWPKLLDASAIEAVSELNESVEINESSKEQIEKWIKEVETGDVSNKYLDNKMEIKIVNSQKNVMYESYTEKNKKNWIHKNMIKK